MSFRNPVTTLPASAITGSLPADQVGSGNFTGNYNIVGAFTTGGTGARVDINPNGIFAYNSGGAQTVNISALNGSVSISGTFTIATAVSGTRMVIDNTGINAFNGATNTFNLNAATGSVSIVGSFITGTTGARVRLAGSQITIWDSANDSCNLAAFPGGGIAGSGPYLLLLSPTDAFNPAQADWTMQGGITKGRIDTSAFVALNASATITGTCNVVGNLIVSTTSNFNGAVTVTAGGINVTGGTVTDSLTATNHAVIPDFASGLVTTSATANTTVTYPVGRFTATAQVAATIRNSTFSATFSRAAFVGNESSASFTIFATQIVGGVTSGIATSVSWVAIAYP